MSKRKRNSVSVIEEDQEDDLDDSDFKLEESDDDDKENKECQEFIPQEYEETLTVKCGLASLVKNEIECFWDSKSKYPELPVKLYSFINTEERKIYAMEAIRKATTKLVLITFDVGLRLDADFVKYNYYKYFTVFYHILNCFSSNSKEDAASRIVTKKAGKGLRLFNLAPVVSRSGRYVLFDSTCICEVLTAAKNIDPQVIPKELNLSGDINALSKKFRNQKLKYWSILLDFSVVKTSKLKFSGSITTDGVSVALHFKRMKITSAVYDDGFSKNGGKFVPLEVGDRPVVVLDPGRKDIFSCFDGTKAVHCSNKEWQEIS
ncbi:hypothetical protein MP638_000519, partial [Amoeboaphelidium occidentale]